MPRGMHLKSSWTASSIASPDERLSLPAFERLRGAPLTRPIPIADFIDYGLWYQRSAVPDLDARHVERVRSDPSGFAISLSDGEELVASRVVLATGLREFPWRPPPFDELGSQFVSHTADRADLSIFNGTRLVVVGAGQSALETAVLAHEAGAHVRVLVRAPRIHWLTRKARLDGGLGRRLYAPSDVGPAGLSWVVAAPNMMHRLPIQSRRRMIDRCIRPAATGWLLPRSQGIALTCARHAVSVSTRGAKVELRLDDGEQVRAEHILLGTGFRPDLGSVSILADELRQSISSRGGQPVLGAGFETSVPGLHIAGALAADSFGPLMRFVSGTWFTAPAVAGLVASRAASTDLPAPIRSSTPRRVDVTRPPA
jgi:hypothetical protein